MVDESYDALHQDSLLARHSSRPAQHLASPRSLTLLSLRCGIMMLCIMTLCLLGIIQINLAMLSLRCGIVNYNASH